ncbi:MAG: Gfo/Idh/MocA family oxidoreductase, partial [Verrucomicrobia bacterium]|nr:Gfo/Idh/MocA family oxidoreductase [Verrucomicrobiota bacterium]
MTAKSDVKIGLVGCGAISNAYFKNLTGLCAGVRMTVCADLDPARATAKAAEHEGVEAVPLDDIFKRPDIDIILNLTIPKAHFEVSMRAVEAGKSTYSEKPLCLTRAEGRELLAAGKAAGVLVGAAPDTFMGAGIQTCRRLIDDGRIGEPIGAQAFMLGHGHESWHPDPEFYYAIGGGPMFDMGPYYLTALINLMGPIAEVAGATRISFPERTITSEKKHGKIITVETPTHVTGIMNFASGAIGTITTSFDVWRSMVPRIEIFGSEATLSVP